MSDAALSDLFVLECAEGVAGPFCGKAFADLGADVVKIEPPRGDRSRAAGPFPGDVAHPERSGQFLYNNANKRGVTLELERGSERRHFLDLAASADVVIIDLPPLRLRDLELDYTHLRAVNDQLVVTCISPFGQTGPYRDYRATELTKFHIGGMGRETPYNQVTNLEQQPPLKAGGHQASYLTGWTAAAATMVALHHRAVYGSGQLVDIAEMEAVASMLRYTFASLSHDANSVWPRHKIGFPWILPCKDGHVSFSPFHFDHWWAGFKDMMGHPAWAEAEMFSTMAARLQYADVLETLSTEWMMGYSKAVLYEMALQRGLPCFPVHSIPEVVKSRQFGVRDFFVTVAHPEAGAVKQPGPPYRLHGTPWRIARPAPRLGEHNAEILVGSRNPDCRRTASTATARPADARRNRPFAGLRVAEFGWALAVPHATAWLGCLGAEVIRIESRTRLDLTRLSPAGVADGVPGVNRSAFFNGVNYGKKSVTLNLSHPEGIALARELVRHADIVAENFSVGTMDKLGLGYEALKAIRPDVIMLSGTPLGRDGPERLATGWGPNTQAYAGLPYITGYEDGAPAGIGGNWPDYMIGTSMVFALLAALRHRQRTGKGQLVEFAMAETVATMIPEAILDYTMNGRDGRRLGNRHPVWAPQGVYPCSGEDAWVAISVRSDREWHDLCRLLGDPTWTGDTRFDTAAGRRQDHDEIDRHLAAWTRSRTHYEVMHLLQSAGIAAAPCLDVRELTTDPQLLERAFLVEIEHHEIGKRLVAGLPARMSNVPSFDYLPAPLLGEHNSEVLCGLLGLSTDELEQLVERQVVF